MSVPPDLQTIDSVGSNKHRLKYQRFILTDCKDIGGYKICICGKNSIPLEFALDTIDSNQARSEGGAKGHVPPSLLSPKGWHTF